MVSITVAAMVGMVLWLGATPLLKRFDDLAADRSTLTWAGRLPSLKAALHHLDDHAGAAQTLQQLVTRFPRQADYQAHLAHAYMRAGDPTAAETAWRRVVQLQPYSATGYVGLARLYEARKDVSNALSMMQRAVSIAPTNIDYQRTLARLL